MTPTAVPLPRHQKLRSSNDDEVGTPGKKGFRSMAVDSSANAMSRVASPLRSPLGTIIVALVAGVLLLSVLVSYSQVEPDVEPTLPPSVVALMDPGIDPCTDFYQYACGGWLANTTLPNDRSRYSRSFDTIQEANDALFIEIVNEKWPLISELYSSCMNTATLDARGAAPLSADLASIREASNKQQLFELMGELSSRSPLPFIIDVAIYPDEKRTSVNTLHVSQSGLTLPDEEYYTNATRFAEFAPALRAYITELFVQIEWTTDIPSAVNTVIDYEAELARRSDKKEHLRDALYTYNPVIDINASHPLVLGAFLAGAKIPLTKDTPVIIATPSFLELAESLMNVAPLEALKTLFAYQYTSSMASSLSAPFRNASFALFGRAIAGQAAPRPRQKQCLSTVDKFLGELLSRYYLQKSFQPEALTAIQTLVQSLVDAFRSRVHGATWMDNATRDAAIAKLGNMTSLLGYPAKRLEYPRLSLSTTDHFSNVQQLIHTLHQRAVGKLDAPVDRNEWLMHAHTVNAYYNPMANQIVFPAGILQPPFFDAGQDLARNYGAIGMVIGHEITHGFDDQGRNFDAEGNMQPWWSAATATAFQAKAQCIAEQYSSFAVKSEATGEQLGHVNGPYTLGEDIADIGGLRVAHEAYTTFVRSQHTSGRSPYTPSNTLERLFFLSYAQSWCTKTTDQGLKSMLDDVHPPAKQRVNGAVMNNDAFARIFSCPRAAVLNPEKKCNVW
ncbi:endothelin-converting enzyme, metalloprotease family M13 [Achlya hypogyna]|uniref:Endothelin-converting enzyme, metalloprotease family M13 n=1 Tax=Achlya hypogyna TaxID=1202772 RepID=A0A1V9YP68_ACHHY|nr:endothelin-converting enzyme, metalloprotease family M13 [Achlya hypogyna]